MEGDDAVDGIVSAWARERPAAAAESMGTITRVWQLAKLFGDRRRRVVTDAGADQATLDLLSTLRRSGEPYELSPGELARRSMVTAGAISQRLTRAETEGLVQRAPSATGRGKTVRLLPAGHELVERLVDDVAAADADLLAGLGPDQQQQLDHLVRLLIDDLARRHGPSAPTHVGSEDVRSPVASLGGQLPERG